MSIKVLLRLDHHRAQSRTGILFEANRIEKDENNWTIYSQPNDGVIKRALEDLYFHCHGECGRELVFQVEEDLSPGIRERIEFPAYLENVSSEIEPITQGWETQVDIHRRSEGKVIHIKPLPRSMGAPAP